MKLYILECYSKHPFPVFGWLIQLFQGFINFHHYALMIQTNDDKLYSYDASGRTLHREHIRNFKEKYEIKRCYEIPYEVDQNSFFRWILPLEGTVYGHSQILGLLLMILNVFKENPFPNGIHKLICNEFILITLKTFNILDINNIESYDMLQTHKLLESHFKEVNFYKILSSYNIR